MKKEITLDEFYQSFIEEVNDAQDTETYGWESQDFFTSIMMDYLEEAGEVNDPILCPFRGYGLQLNAYSVSDDYENVDIFVSVYNPDDVLTSVSRSIIDATIKRGIQLYRKAVNDLYTSFEKDNDTYGFAKALHDHKDAIKNVRIVALTNGLVKSLDLKEIELEGARVSFTVWDIERLYKCITSGKMREIIEIDFEDAFGVTIPCIENKS